MPTRFRRIALARLFFGAPEDIRHTCQVVLNLLPGHTKGEAALLFFEERSLLGAFIYPGIQYFFWQLDESVFIGTAGTAPGIHDVSRSLQAIGARDVYLVPFLPYQTPALAAWETALEDSGYRVRPTSDPLIGQAEAQGFMIERLLEALAELGMQKR
jgi:cobalamin biosynthesis Co2+ chelatase CbiK